MTRFKSILALADFSPKSDNAVRRAALLARQHRATLHLLHVVEPAPLVDVASWPTKRPDAEIRAARAHRSLATLATRISKELRVTVRHGVRTGDALAEIRDLARSMDLVVIGAKRTNPLREFVLGTPTERLLRILERPILVVKLPADTDYARALVPMGLSPDSDIILQMTANALSGAALRMCQAPSDPAEENGVTGDHASPILEQQSALGSELIVIAKDGHSVISDFLLGTVAQRLIAGASCDVMVLPRTAIDGFMVTGKDEQKHSPMNRRREVATAPSTAAAASARGRARTGLSQ